MKNKIFVLGIDGATMEFLNRKELPTFQKLIEDGISGTLLSRPAITSVAWPSMVSGVNAGKHGIFGFRKGEELKLSYDKKAKELWDYAKTIAINIPMTFPVRKIDGIMISGMMTPSFDSDCVYPDSEKEFLKSIGFKFEPDIDLSDIEKQIDIKFQIIDKYVERDFEIFFIVFREYDVIQHFFYNDNLKFYKMMDDFLKKFLEEHKDKFSHLLIVSDHGFTKIDKTFNLELFIKQSEFAESVNVGGWGAIYLQDKSIKQVLIKKLGTVEFEGKKILDVYPQEEIYWGPYADEGPDIVVSPKRELGFTFGMRTKKVIEKSDHKDGCHLEEGVFVLNGADIKPNKGKFKIFDVFPTIFDLLKKDIPEGIDGNSVL